MSKFGMWQGQNYGSATKNKGCFELSNRLFQGVIHQMKDSIDRTVGVIDENYTVIACSELGKIGETHEIILSAGNISSNEAFVKGQYTYKPFGTPQRPEYILFVEGNDPQAAKYASILSISLSNIKFYYDEKYDRSNFIKNIILDNILPGDIYLKARELRFNSDVARTVFLIRVTSNNDMGGTMVFNSEELNGKLDIFSMDETEAEEEIIGVPNVKSNNNDDVYTYNYDDEEDEVEENVVDEVQEIEEPKVEVKKEINILAPEPEETEFVGFTTLKTKAQTRGGNSRFERPNVEKEVEDKVEVEEENSADDFLAQMEKNLGSKKITSETKKTTTKKVAASNKTSAKKPAAKKTTTTKTKASKK